MITLYQFAPAFDLPNASPFCMKLETYLRMAQLPFEAPAVSMRDFGNSPTGKMPYIKDGSKTIADSTFIIDYLKQTYGDPLDGWLSAEQRALALAFQRLLEENLYWALVYTRWIEAPGWQLTRTAFFGALPVPLCWIVPPLARRGIGKQLHGHGMGRHSAQEIHAIGRRDITALANFLAEKPYILGAAPSSLDAVAYAFLANLLWVPLESALKQHAQQYPQLQTYCQRLRNQYYPQG
jgi:glutathione S-transferase